MERHFRQDVTSFWIIALLHLFFLLDQSFGKYHCTRLRPVSVHNFVLVMTYGVSGTYSKLLLIHYIVIHFLTKYPALIEEPCLFTSTDIGSGVVHVVVPCNFTQEC